MFINVIMNLFVFAMPFLVVVVCNHHEVYSACPINVCNMGTCFIINNNSQCRCPKTHTGKFCEQPVSDDKITNKLLMNTQPNKKNLNYLQSDSKSSVSVDPIASISINSENNHPHQNIESLSEIKREKFNLCTLPEFQFTTDCLHVKSHLATFIGTAITCSMIILLLTFCAAYFRRKKLINRRRQECQCLSNENQLGPRNSIKSVDHRSLSIMPDNVNFSNNTNELKSSPSPFKSIASSGKLYTDSLDKDCNIDKLQPTIKNLNHNNNILLTDNANDNLTYKCSVSTSSCSNTAFVVWTTAPEIIRQEGREFNVPSLEKILIHANPQQQQNLKEQQLQYSTSNSYSSATISNPFTPQEVILNNDALINQNDISALLSSATTPPIISGSKLCSLTNLQLTDLSNKVQPLTNILVQNPLETSIKSKCIVNKSQKPKETIQCCTNIYNDSVTNSQISNISTVINDNSLQQFATFDTVLQSTDANEHFFKHVYHTTDSLLPESSSSSPPQNTCLILNQDNLNFSSKLVYFCPNSYHENN
ncbi:Protein vein isoform 1 [Schistosoma japonicum]|uniref:Protein vein isoform 1 n=1 Tax=Schistosoma japonicum TaxID=6182 RepID=A0A4Z2DFM1_SCHJA|nr:Protein vein isoform 1 [Schistosoma japonicum]